MADRNHTLVPLQRGGFHLAAFYRGWLELATARHHTPGAGGHIPWSHARSSLYTAHVCVLPSIPMPEVGGAGPAAC